MGTFSFKETHQWSRVVHTTCTIVCVRSSRRSQFLVQDEIQLENGLICIWIRLLSGDSSLSTSLVTVNGYDHLDDRLETPRIACFCARWSHSNRRYCDNDDPARKGSYLSSKASIQTINRIRLIQTMSSNSLTHSITRSSSGLFSNGNCSSMKFNAAVRTDKTLLPVTYWQCRRFRPERQSEP